MDTIFSLRFQPRQAASAGGLLFMRALPALLDAVPDAHVLMIGSDKARGYGLTAPKGTKWRTRMMDELGSHIDAERVHFTGPVSYETMLSALSLSWAHVYYTYPFVLSWSVLEAMACGCLVLGSDTPPVRDAIKHGSNGLLLKFFDVDGLSQAMIEACRKPERFTGLRSAARKTIIRKFDRANVCLPMWLDTIKQLLPARALRKRQALGS